MSGDPLTGLTPESAGDALSSFGAEDLRGTNSAGAETSLVSAVEIRRAAPLRFVDAVALVQAICDANVRERGPLGALPELAAVFLTSSGDIAIEGPFSSSSPARQAARLLHDLVSPEQTPPAARLFIGRWTNSDAPTLTDFIAELTYFARPNGRDLIAALYARSAGSSSSLPLTLPSVAPRAIVEQPRKSEVEPVRPRAHEIVAWLQAHRREVIGATAVALAFIAAGLTVWMWPSTAAAGRTQSAAVAMPGSDVDQPGTNGTGNRTAPAAATTGQSSRSRTVRTPAAASPNTATTPLEVKTPSLPLPAEMPSVPAPPPQVPAVETPAQTARPARVYTSADADVEPPVLRSSEIPEWLITGFEVRKNSVELLISADGDVQRARMLGAPQRLPDVMLLSRVKEWMFIPATKGGVPVPYRLVLSWNVTP